MIPMRTRRRISCGLAGLGLLTFGYLSRPAIDSAREYAKPRIAYTHQKMNDFMDPVGAYIRSNEFVQKYGTRADMANWASGYAMAQGPENSGGYRFWEDVILRATEKKENIGSTDVSEERRWHVPKEMADRGITQRAGNIPARVLGDTKL